MRRNGQDEERTPRGEAVHEPGRKRLDEHREARERADDILALPERSRPYTRCAQASGVMLSDALMGLVPSGAPSAPRFLP